MTKHYAEFVTVGSEEHIVRIHSSALEPISSGWKLIDDDAEKRGPPTDNLVSVGGIGRDDYKYKIMGSAPVWTRTARTASEIQAAYEWMNDHRISLTTNVKKRIKDLGEDYFQTLTMKENRGTSLSDDEKDDINAFIAASDSKKDVNFHDVAATFNYSRFNTKLAVAGTNIKLKRMPSGWAVDDTVRIIDYQEANPKDFTVTITAINVGGKHFDCADPGHTSEFDRLTSFAYKVG